VGKATLAALCKNSDIKKNDYCIYVALNWFWKWSDALYLCNALEFLFFLHHSCNNGKTRSHFTEV